MTDRQFSDCCYGTAYQHSEWQECPLTLHFDTWTGTWRDRYNDVFAGRRGDRKLFEVTERAPGNQIVLHSRHRSEEAAKLAAQVIVARRLAERA